MSKIRLWESQRELAKCLSMLRATMPEICSIFGSSDAATRTAIAGQKASTGYLDLTGGKQRSPAMAKREYDDILMLAQRQLKLHPALTGPYDRLRKLLAATYEDTAAEEIAVAERESGVAGAITRLADTYGALGEQLVELARQARAEHTVGLEMLIVHVLDDRLPKLLAQAIEAYFS